MHDGIGNRNVEANEVDDALAKGWTFAAPASALTPESSTVAVEVVDDHGLTVSGEFPDPRRLSEEQIEDAINEFEARSKFHALVAPARRYVSLLHQELAERVTAHLIDTKAIQTDVEERAEYLEAAYTTALEALAAAADAVDAVNKARPGYEAALTQATKHSIPVPARVHRISVRASNDPGVRNLHERLRVVAGANW
jgi:hypothetical protein